MKRKLTKWEDKGGAHLFGLRFRFVDGDYDYCYLKSVRYRYSRQMYLRMLQIKYENQCDYDRCEYDCTGSTQIRIRIKRTKDNHLIMYYHESKDC